MEAGLYSDSFALPNESYEFINKMKRFQDTVGSLTEGRASREDRKSEGGFRN